MMQSRLIPARVELIESALVAKTGSVTSDGMSHVAVKETSRDSLIDVTLFNEHCAP
jgi:hypothetical protein